MRAEDMNIIAHFPQDKCEKIVKNYAGGNGL